LTYGIPCGRARYRWKAREVSFPASPLRPSADLGTFQRILTYTSEGATLASAQQLVLSLAELLLLQYPVSLLRRVVRLICPRSLSDTQQAVWAVCEPFAAVHAEGTGDLTTYPCMHGKPCVLTSSAFVIQQSACCVRRFATVCFCSILCLLRLCTRVAMRV
jgi:hypothetical protein